MTKYQDSFEDLPTVTLPTKFVRHWQDEALRLRDLAEVLFRSLKARGELSGRGAPRGDETLAKHMEESLDALWGEIEDDIEEVSFDGNWRLTRNWEPKDE